MVDLAEVLAALEAQAGGAGKLPCLEEGSLDRLRQLVKEQGGLPITLDCRKKLLPVNDVDLVGVIAPLSVWLKGLVEAHSAKGGRRRRILVGVIGAAGAGKSTLVQLICLACGVLWRTEGGAAWVQCVSMDGYSLPNSHLSAQSAKDHLGRSCTLKDVKGVPSTLDADAFLGDLVRLRSPDSATQAILLPAYDRDLHDPVTDSVTVAPECRVVIVEGLHLLHRKGKWKNISEAFNRTVFLDIERSCCFERVVARKVSNGRSRESSEAHFERVDGPTFDQLQEEKHHANLVLSMHPNDSTNGLDNTPLHISAIDSRLGRQGLDTVPVS